MKKIFDNLGRVLFSILYFRKKRKFKNIDKIIRKAMIKKSTDQLNREVAQSVLKHKITAHMRKFQGMNAQSSFIKKKPKNNAICRKEIYAVFGDEMKECGLKLSKTLRFICTP